MQQAVEIGTPLRFAGPGNGSAKKKASTFIADLSVPRTGLEPARPYRAPAPQAGVSTDFTIWA